MSSVRFAFSVKKVFMNEDVFNVSYGLRLNKQISTEHITQTYHKADDNNPTFLLTPWSRVLLEKLTGFQLVNKFPAFYRARRFITAFTSACHLYLS